MNPIELADDDRGELLLGLGRLRLVQPALQQLGGHPCRTQRRLDFMREPVEHFFANGVVDAPRFAAARFPSLRRIPRRAQRFLDGHLESADVDRLGQEGVCLLPTLRARGAEQQEGDCRQLGVRAERAQELDSGPPRHHVIADYQIGALRPREEQRIFPVVRPQRTVPEIFDDVGADLEHRGLVLGNEHDAHQEVSSSTAALIGCAWPVSSPLAERSGVRTRIPWSAISNSRRSFA